MCGIGQTYVASPALLGEGGAQSRGTVLVSVLIMYCVVTLPWNCMKYKTCQVTEEDCQREGPRITTTFLNFTVDIIFLLLT